MEKKHAHINGGGCNKLATCLLFHFPLREWPRFENRFWKCFFGAPFSPFFHFSFFIFEHFPPKKWKKNTRTSMVAAITRLLRVCFFIFHYESGLVLKIVFENFFWCAFSPFFFFFFSHSLVPPVCHYFVLYSSSKAISFLFARSGWPNGSHLCLDVQPHRHREAPPINRRRQVGWWEIERQIKSARAYDDS